MNKKWLKGLAIGLSVSALGFSSVPVETVMAAPKGFVIENGKHFYYDNNGQKHKGWLTIGNKRYLFSKIDGKQFRGWHKNSKGALLRYFKQPDGSLLTGWYTSPKAKNTRFFRESDGRMAVGWQEIDGKTYYFDKTTGALKKGWMEVGNGDKVYFKNATGELTKGWIHNKAYEWRYFSKENGHMLKGLQTIDGKKYFFYGNTGYRAHDTTVNINGKSYYFGSDGVETTRPNNSEINSSKESKAESASTASAKASDTKDLALKNTSKKVPSYANMNLASKNGLQYLIYQDPKNGKSYAITKNFYDMPGLREGNKSTLDYLAAICEAEAGDQGFEGMEAVAMCILNRTIHPNREWPSSIAMVIFQYTPYGGGFPQYSVVTNGSLYKRLILGQFENREFAYSAARSALNKFKNYRNHGTPRTINGIARDFNYNYFMMTGSFWQQPLNFNKVVKTTYKDHTFFVDWV